MKKNVQPLILTVNGATVKPELARHLTKKRQGHALTLRVRKDGKDIAYLETDLYVMPSAFDADLKQLRDADANKELTTMVARAGKLLATNPNPEQLKASWTRERQQMVAQDFIESMELIADWSDYVSLTRRRDELEKELVLLNEKIKVMESEQGITPLPTVSQLDVKEYDKALAEFMLTLQGKKVRDQNAFKYCFQSIQDYATYTNQIIGLQSFDYTFYIGYAKYLMYQKDNYNNAFGAKIKKLKAFLKWCEENGYSVNKGYKDKRFKILEEEKLVVYLNDSELELIWQYKQIKPEYSKVIDLLLFQSLTGLRVSDTLKKQRLTTKNGEQFLTGICTKNKGKFCVPVSLDTRIEEILKTYDYDMKIVSEAYYNRTMKEVIKNVYAFNGLTMPEITYTRMKLTNEIEFTEPKYALISSHSMRRGFCTRHLNSGYFSETDVLEMLGSSDMKELQKYIIVESDALSRKAKQSAQNREGVMMKIA